MKTLRYWMSVGGFDVEVAYPTVVERIMIYEILCAHNITLYAPEVEWVYNDVVKVVPMTEREIEWFTRL